MKKIALLVAGVAGLYQTARMNGINSIQDVKNLFNKVGGNLNELLHVDKLKEMVGFSEPEMATA
jgi:hypothetical protein